MEIKVNGKFFGQLCCFMKLRFTSRLILLGGLILFSNCNSYKKLSKGSILTTNKWILEKEHMDTLYFGIKPTLYVRKEQIMIEFRETQEVIYTKSQINVESYEEEWQISKGAWSYTKDRKGIETDLVVKPDLKSLEIIKIDSISCVLKRG